MANPHPPPNAPRPMSPHAPGTSPRDPLLAALTVVGAALLVVGSFLPWAALFHFQGVTGVINPHDRSGNGADGRITLGAGVAGVLLGLGSLAGAPRILVRILLALAALAAAGTGAHDLVTILTDARSFDFPRRGVDTGIYLTVAGAAVLVVAFLASLRRVPCRAPVGAVAGPVPGAPGGLGAPVGYGRAAGAGGGLTPGYGGGSPGDDGPAGAPVHAAAGYGDPTAPTSAFDAPTAAAAFGGGGDAPPLSPDRQWWWDGSRWNDVRTSVPPGAQRSPDGYYWWDGQEWRPAAG